MDTILKLRFHWEVLLAFSGDKNLKMTFDLIGILLTYGMWSFALIEIYLMFFVYKRFNLVSEREFLSENDFFVMIVLGGSSKEKINVWVYFKFIQTVYVLLETLMIQTSLFNKDFHSSKLFHLIFQQV